ncbi:hypothetical protein C3432_19535 [Citrobacter amalonaticus]|uniref:Fimbrial protein n=1 Tax=Citrobacter amalonaticus TaxID=35703 RepID=A0A2S4RXM0_CITAM|nr:hypothetical protein [Citrobacter amalonaticus]POT56170.1 hypothetical protein C3432_19535 [Citrobacter amalonaticus]POT74479.1 hypothetical protein C3436_17175 [Citrobacter amalonaticus]POU65278.1 hypothetical protein C3430_13915 [Citrobacter amalonaticus]POV04113.1 hypothetical protein C3424_18855 [Citrobacter amalonaticus]
MKMINHRRRMVAALLGTLLVAGAAHSQSIDKLHKVTGTLNVTVSDGTTCSITPDITAPDLSTFDTWTSFGKVDFGCQKGGTDTSATIGIAKTADMVKDAAKPDQFYMTKDALGSAVTAAKYFVRFGAQTGTSVRAATADDLAVNFMDGLVGTTDVAGGGTVGLDGYVNSGSAPAQFTIPLMVMAWN